MRGRQKQGLPEHSPTPPAFLSTSLQRFWPSLPTEVSFMMAWAPASPLIPGLPNVLPILEC